MKIAKLSCRKNSLRELFSHIVKKRSKTKLLKKIYEHYGITQEEVLGGSIIISLLVTATIFTITTLTNIFDFSLGIKVIISVLIGSIVYYYFNEKFIRDYIKKSHQIEIYADLILEEFTAILTATNSITEAITYIAQENYSEISKAFREILKQINYGNPPELLLLEYIEKGQPSQTLRENLTTIIQLYQTNKEEKTEETLNQLSKYYSWNVQNKYIEETQNLMAKTTATITFLTFFPITYAIISILGGHTSDFFIIALPFLQLTIAMLAYKKILTSQIELIE
ncbi:MAG: type II secretion system F family protein [Candidatus Wukongarchaeota archaeon]|nr:type II secretion system F family protein [Candidatus Wukongarchaeota archaeon]